jgi:hypothetical protein
VLHFSSSWGAASLDALLARLALRRRVRALQPPAVCSVRRRQVGQQGQEAAHHLMLCQALPQPLQLCIPRPHGCLALPQALHSGVTRAQRCSLSRPGSVPLCRHSIALCHSGVALCHSSVALRHSGVALGLC